MYCHTEEHKRTAADVSYLDERDKVVLHEVAAAIGGHHSNKSWSIIMAALGYPETE